MAHKGARSENEAAGLGLLKIGGLVTTSNDGSQSSHEFVARAQIQ